MRSLRVVVDADTVSAFAGWRHLLGAQAQTKWPTAVKMGARISLTCIEGDIFYLYSITYNDKVI